MKSTLRSPYTIIVLLALATLISRFYALQLPPEKVFDEVYFPVFAHNYLTGTDFFDAHPPLGKLIIATGIALFGNESFGWRIMNAITGSLLVLAIAGFTYDISKRYTAAFIAALLVITDPMSLVESRIGLINIYLAIFSILGLWRYWRWHRDPNKTSQLLWACIFFALATSVKWIGIGAAVAAASFTFLAATLDSTWRKDLKLTHLLPPLLIPLIYVATFLPDMLRGQDLFWWHESTFNYHAGLTATHPYGSAWWTWPFSLRPLWLYYQNRTGTIRGILEIGNIVTWIGGIYLLVYALIKTPRRLANAITEHRALLFLLVSYFMLYLPWAAISRVKFIYHYFVPVLILFIISSLVLDRYILSNREYRWLGITYLTLGALFFLFFLPLLVGIPVSEAFYKQHLWLQSWI